MFSDRLHLILKTNVLVVLDVFIKAFELSDLEGKDADEGHHHQEERVDPPLHQNLHLWRDSWKNLYCQFDAQTKGKKNKHYAKNE